MTVSDRGPIATVSIQQFIAAVERLRADAPYPRSKGIHSYTTKDQWIGWLKQYHTPGYYGRKGSGYDARFAYMHVQNHQMLIWLLGAAGLDAPTLVRAAAAAVQGSTMAQKAAAVRKLVPWERAFDLLWPDGVATST